MSRQLKGLICLLLLLSPGVVSAQIFQSILEPSNVEVTPKSLPGSVELVIEAETYKPSFYRGRAEPTVGNIVRLVAIPLGQPPENFSYQWGVDGQALSSTGPVATFTDPFKEKARITVNVIASDGSLFAQDERIVALSRPQVVFYEENVLRGHGAQAIRDNFILIGEGAVIRAEPFFVGLASSAGAYRSTWSVNGLEVNSGGDWRELLLQRPDSPLSNYKLEFRANNENNLAEGVNGAFNLQFGL